LPFSLTLALSRNLDYLSDRMLVAGEGIFYADLLKKIPLSCPQHFFMR
jgi:hypothetical protein